MNLNLLLSKNHPMDKTLEMENNLHNIGKSLLMNNNKFINNLNKFIKYLNILIKKILIKFLKNCSSLHSKKVYSIWKKLNKNKIVGKKNQYGMNKGNGF